MADPDELAHTATADASAERPKAPELGTTLGRYRLERMLGEGGMGVVHAAFDPDLERRVALKVLRKTDAHGEARSRLLREARAMARLTHENVVTVHEVGTSDDRDYVAMELIDGETLAEWLKEKPRDVREIVDAFVAAGRGLAAAHAAGLVHRDFKPHNVLRRRDGKIVVTDFGLARGVENTQAVALDNTLELGDSHPSDLTGITKTGSVLGTPAYMAPEQWLGGVVGAAADQFAFCVALWEALTGSRPFKGETIEELKAEVKRGPAALDASKLPRRLRRTLIRGLEPDASKRWPNMDVLLGRIRLAERHIGLAFALVGGALVAALVAIFAMHRGPTCDPPVIDPTQVWQEAYGQTMPPEMSKLFNAQITHWAVARASACTADPLARQVQLHCLDGVLVRLDVIRQAMAATAGIKTDDVIDELVDPSVCLSPAPPRLALTNSADAITAYKQLAIVIADNSSTPGLGAVAAKLAQRADLDACTKSIALVTAARAETEYQPAKILVDDAITSSEQCEDDRLHADIMLFAAPLSFEIPLIGPKGQEALRRAESAISRISQPQLRASLDLMRARVANQRNQHQEALDLADHAVAAYGANGQVRYAISRGVKVGLELRYAYGGIEQMSAMIARWLPVAKALGEDDSVAFLNRYAAVIRMTSGDVVGAHAELLKLWKQHADAKPPHPFHGTVVDRENKPVVGATVASASFLFADSVGIPLVLADEHDDDTKLRVTTTDDAGHFSFSDAAEIGAVEAQLGDRRSPAMKIVDGVKLVVEPTRRIAGKVALNGAPNVDCEIVVEKPGADKSFNSRFVAPIAPDGSFAIDGASQDAVRLGVAYHRPESGSSMTYTTIPASTEPVTGLSLAVPSSKRTLAVIARSSFSQPLEAAQVVVLAGSVAVKTVGELDAKMQDGLLVRFAKHVVGESVPKDLVASYHTGDLTAEFTDVPDGTLTVCAIGMPGNLQDEAMRDKINKHRNELEMRCETLDGATNAVVVVTPPTKNFD